MLAFLDFVIAVAGTMMLLVEAIALGLLVLLAISGLRGDYVNAHTKRGGERIVRRTVADGVGKP